MPVRINHGQSKVTANGAVPIECDTNAVTSTIVPLLIVASDVSQLRIDNTPLPGDPPLRPLSSRQQLVAVAGSGDLLATKLFPGDPIVILHVDPLDPLPGPALAWQALDALIVDGPWPGSFDPHKVPELLAGGTEITVRSLDRPDDALPWEAIDGGWVLRPFIAGPLGCDGNLETYAPVAGWHPDLPGSARLQVVLAAVLFSVAILACLLLQERWRLPAMTILSFVFAIGIGIRRSDILVLFSGMGNVIVHSVPVLQNDHWEFFAARGATKGTCACDGEAWPLFADSLQPLACNAKLHWKDGTGRFTFDLPVDGKLAFVSRTLFPPTTPATIYPAIAQPVLTETPMAAIGRALYLHAHQRMTTEAGSSWDESAPSPDWPDAHIWP